MGEAILARFALGVESGVRRPHSLDSLADVGEDGMDSSDGACRLPSTELRVIIGIFTLPANA